MTLTPSRDWQKDYEGAVESLIAAVDRADAAEDREQRLKGLLLDAIGCLMIHTSDDNSDVKRISQGLRTLYADTLEPKVASTSEITAKPIDEWHEDYGDVLWWTFPIEESPYCGSPLDVDWPGYHTHWTPLVNPTSPAPKEDE